MANKNEMYFKVISLFVFIWFAIAEEIKPCNPLEDKKCDGLTRALSRTVVDTFSDPSPLFGRYSERGDVVYGEDGLKLVINQRFDNPSLKSSAYILFGKVEVIAKSAPGRGIISSVFLQSDDLDEIDLEWIGSNPSAVQTNYFAKGDVRDYSRGEYHHVEDAHDMFHNYTIDWSNERMLFFVDNEQVRRVDNNEQTQEYGYPQSPMAVFIGIWVGGDVSNSQGTIDWAGGLTDYTECPYEMEVKQIIVTDYSSGSNYKYTDKSGEWTSIRSIGGKVNERMEQANMEFNILANGGALDNDMESMRKELLLDQQEDEAEDVYNRRSFVQFSLSQESSGESNMSRLKISNFKTLLLVCSVLLLVF